MYKFITALLGLKGDEFLRKSLKLQPARLTEDAMEYESLMMYNNFSDNETHAKFLHQEKS